MKKFLIITLSLSFLIISLALAYYLVLFLPQKYHDDNITLLARESVLDECLREVKVQKDNLLTSASSMSATPVNLSYFQTMLTDNQNQQDDCYKYQQAAH